MALKEPDVSTVFSLLRDSLKADQALRGPAVDDLSNYDSQPGFYSRLLDIIAAKDPPSHDDVRLSAAIYFKNTIKCYWENSLTTSEYEKTNLRKKLLSQLQEENDQIAQMLAIAISTIAHIDYPRKWPELFSVLAQQLEAADILTSHRIFEVLSLTISNLARKNLTAEGMGLSEISSHLFGYCWKLWKIDKQTIFDNFSFSQSFAISNSAEQQLHHTWERWLYCSSIIHKIITSGFARDAEYVKALPVDDVCRQLISAVKLFAPYYSNFQPHHKLLFIHRTCVNLMKYLVRIRWCHPNFFGDKTVLEPILKFCLDKIMSAEHEKHPLMEQLLMECMFMVKSVLESIQFKGCRKYNIFNGTRDIAEDVKRNVCNVVESLLPSESVKSLCKILIIRYFLFTETDLEEWSQDPERFYHEQNMKAYKLRPRAKALYIALFRRYRQLLGPFVISILREATNDLPAKETDGRPRMLLREAAYTAVNHVYHEPSDNLNSNELFEGVLCPEIYNDHPNMHIIHSKIASILQIWSLKEKGDMRKQVFFALIRLLSYDDLTVRLAACQSLGFLVEEIDFQEEDFRDLLPSCWGLFSKLLEDVEEFKSERLVLDPMLSMIKFIGEETIPFASKLVDILDKALKESTGDGVLQTKILQVRHDFVIEFQNHSSICYKMFRRKEKKKRKRRSKRMSEEMVSGSQLLINKRPFRSRRLCSGKDSDGSFIKNTTREARGCHTT